MSRYLYRYISFETFVGMIQNKTLTFVSPTMWDDPKETVPFKALVGKTDDPYKQAMLIAMMNKTYCQSWSKAIESDAMWRIYSYQNHALQIKVSEDKLSQLDGVQLIPVEYSNRIDLEPNEGEESFLRSLAIKRRAFVHEKEVRLIKRYVFTNPDDAENHVKALMVLYEHKQSVEILESMYPGCSIDEKIQNIVRLLNYGVYRKETMDVSFENIPDFISGVKVHPMAPQWYVQIVMEYCKRNSIPFAGQSTLYSKE